MRDEECEHSSGVVEQRFGLRGLVKESVSNYTAPFIAALMTATNVIIPPIVVERFVPSP